MTYKNIQDLKDFIQLTSSEEAELDKILIEYPMRIPQYYLDLIDFNDPMDPIRLMSIPSVFETDSEGSFDTSGEQHNTKLPGLQHKYAETVMILSTNKCAMYCRHCFRKRLVGTPSDEVAAHLPEIAEYISSHSEISNVLISGGDSLMNSTDLIRRYLELLTPIEHLDFIRFGSRIPVVFPERITNDSALLDLFEEFSAKKQLVVVTQFNHPRELTPQSKQAVRLLQERGIMVRNQAVLMRDINSDPEILSELLKGLTACGITPYYIFQCRPVVGVKNRFQVPILEGMRIVEKAKAKQNGFGKGFKYCMSHVSGKIELLGQLNGEAIMKYHEFKDPKDAGAIFSTKLDENQCWLPDDFQI